MELNLHRSSGDNMLKTIKIILIISLTLFVLQGCKDPTMDFEWFQFDAEGAYSSETGTSHLELNAWVRINQSSVNMSPSNSADSTHFQSATVVNWAYTIYAGEQVVAEIASNNISLQFDEIHLNVAKDQIDYLWVAILSINPLSGDIFNGLDPDRVEVEMSIYDSDGNAYFVSNSVPFLFTRN